MGTTAFAAAKSEQYVQTLVLFPMDNAAGEKGAKAAADLTAFIKTGLAGNSNYLVVPFSDRLPAVQRILAAQPEKKDLAVGPYSGDPESVGRALGFARSMSADLAVVGSLDESAFDTSASQARLTATVQLLDVRSGKPVRSVTASGTAAKGDVSGAATEAAIIGVAVTKLGEKVVTEITGKSYTAAAPIAPGVAAPSVSKSKKKSWLPILVLSLGVGLLLGGGGGGGGSSSGPDVPPNPPPTW